MRQQPDITVTLPVEYFDILSAVISSGLKHANIKSLDRKELGAWWTAEKELIEGELHDNN